jgi:regulator of replication initiation timing
MIKCPLCDLTTGHSHFSYDIAEYVDKLQTKLEQRIALEIDEHLKVVELQAKLDVAVEALGHARTEVVQYYPPHEYTLEIIDEALKRLEALMSEEMLRVEFYGIDGYCAACHQPLEGRSCPYCSWEDKSPSQHKYVKKVNTFDDFFAECEKDPEFRREYLRVTMDETRDLILENKSLRKQLDEWKEAHDNLARQLSVTNDSLEIAVEGLVGIYNQHEHIDNEYAQGAAKMASEALKRLNVQG